MILDSSLDKGIIKGIAADKTPLKVNKAIDLSKHTLAIFTSIFIHLLLAVLLFFMAEKQLPKQVKITQQAIKSYLYKR